MAKKQRHANTEEFRRKAVRRSDQAGNTAALVAKELGLRPGQIYNWRRQLSRLSEKQFNSLSGVDYSQQESEGVGRLKRELHAARKENEFLKKLLRTSRSSRSEVRSDCGASGAVHGDVDVPGAGGIPLRVLQVEEAPTVCRPATQGEGREQGDRVVRRVQGALRRPQVGAGTEGGGAALLEELCGQYYAVTRHSSS